MVVVVVVVVVVGVVVGVVVVAVLGAGCVLEKVFEAWASFFAKNPSLPDGTSRSGSSSVSICAKPLLMWLRLLLSMLLLLP